MPQLKKRYDGAQHEIAVHREYKREVVVVTTPSIQHYGGLVCITGHQINWRPNKADFGDFFGAIWRLFCFFGCDAIPQARLLQDQYTVTRGLLYFKSTFFFFWTPNFLSSVFCMLRLLIANHNTTQAQPHRRTPPLDWIDTPPFASTPPPDHR